MQVIEDGRRRSLGVHPTRAEAEAILEAALEDLANDEHREGITLRAWGRQALDRREMHGLRGVDRERSRWATHVDADEIADLPVRSLVRGDVQRWLDRRMFARTQGSRAKRGKSIARQTAANALVLLRAVLEDAAARGITTSNVARDVQLPRARGRTAEPWTYLTPPEQWALLGATPPAVRPAVAFAIWTGLRQGEQWALPLDDVHLEDEAPHVMVRFGAPGKPTKSGKPRRVDLLPEAVAAVRAQLEHLAAHEKAWRRSKRRTRAAGERWNEHRLLFPTARGTRRLRGAPTGWEKWVEVVGRPVRWHDLRHTCASSLIAGWWGRCWSLVEVRAMLGHSTIQVTERYAHLAGTITEEAAKATRRALGVSTPSAPAGGAESAKCWSHFRDLNSRPTVYEREQGPSEIATLALRSARARALDAAALVEAGGRVSAARLVAAIEGIVDAVDVALAERPRLRAVKGGRS